MKKYITWVLTFFIIFNCIAVHVPIKEVKAANQADSLVSKAKSQIGIKERSSGSDDIMYNDWYYGRVVNNNGVSGKYAWCAVFVSWCAKEVGIPEQIIPKTNNTTTMKNLLLKSGGVSHLKGSGYSPKCGDIIFFGSNAGKHVGIVDYTSNGRVYYIDGNNTQTNPHGVHYSNCSLSYSDLWGFVTPNYSVSTSAPTNPQISKNQVWYDMQDRIEITAYADGATNYFMSMFKDGHKIISQGVDGGKFVMDAQNYGQGDYSVYFSCSNNAGSIDTKWIDFSVVGAAGYTDVFTSSWWYDLTDIVSISINSVCAKGQRVEIDRVTPENVFLERVIQENCEPTYTIPATQLGIGNYCAYFYVYNGSGGIYTKVVYFEIVDKPKENAVASTSQSNYTLKDEVEISVAVYCSKYQWIGIERNGERVITERITDAKYRIPASDLGRGNYSAYFTVANGSGEYDTSKVEFSIDNEISNPSIAMAKNKFGLSEDIKITASADGGIEYYTAIIYDNSGKEVLRKKFTGQDILIPSSKLGKGIFTVKVLCSNYAFNAETESVTFEIVCTHSYTSQISTSPTCTTPGVKTYICSGCGDTYTETIKAAGHNYKETIIRPTEQAQGYTLHECTICDYSYKSDYTDSKEHHYVVVEEKEASCTMDGYNKFRCTDCDKEYIIEIPAEGHAFETQVILPTCEEKGYSRYVCSVCGESYNDTYTDEKGHNFVSTVTKEATCEEDGIVTYTCQECGKEEACTIAKLEHHYKERVKKQQTCTDTGIKEYICELCGDTYTEIIPSNGHSYIETVIEPTLEERGYTLHTCTECGDTYKDRYTPPAGSSHTLVSDAAVEPSCTQDGKTEGSHCSICDEVIEEQKIIPALGHDYQAEFFPAAMGQDGSIGQKCCRCGETDDETEVILAPKTIKLSKMFRVYNGKSQKPSVAVKDRIGKSLSKNTDFTISYPKNMKNVGKYTIKIEFQGNYNGTEERDFTIIPKSTSITKAVPKKKGVALKWKKQKEQVSGYEIVYSTDKKFRKNVKLKIIGSAKTNAYSLTKLKSGKRYYVKICTYKKVNVDGKATKIYSEWCKVKTFVVK